MVRLYYSFPFLQNIFGGLGWFGLYAFLLVFFLIQTNKQTNKIKQPNKPFALAQREVTTILTQIQNPRKKNLNKQPQTNKQNKLTHKNTKTNHEQLPGHCRSLAISDIY